MHYKEIGILAKTNKKLENSMSPEEKLCCTSLRWLYKCYLSRQIDLETLTEESAGIKQSYEQATESHTEYVESLKQYQQNIRNAGHLRAEILKGLESGTAADKLLLLAVECIGRMTGEMRIYEIVRDKLAKR